MAITDYISATTLQAEGWVNVADAEQMFERMDKSYLAARGYTDASRLAGIRISLNQAAGVVGISTTTLGSYANLGYIQVGDDGKVSLLDALAFDYAAAKRKELDNKRRMKLR